MLISYYFKMHAAPTYHVKCSNAFHQLLDHYILRTLWSVTIYKIIPPPSNLCFILNIYDLNIILLGHIGQLQSQKVPHLLFDL